MTRRESDERPYQYRPYYTHKQIRKLQDRYPHAPGFDAAAMLDHENAESGTPSSIVHERSPTNPCPLCWRAAIIEDK